MIIEKTKALRFSGLKTSPSSPGEAQLALINRFTRRKFNADEIYIGQLRLAHNAIDRDGERFSEEVLERFKASIVRRTMLFDHARYDAKNSAIGKFFDVEMEAMSIEKAAEILGEDLSLPAGILEVVILAPWFYIPVNGIDQQTLTKIDAGIYDYASIGFRAEALVPITDSNGNTLYHEFRGRGKSTEATEGSLVYLGAQPGMGVKSSGGTDVSGTGDNSNPKPFTHKGGNSEMEELKKFLETLSAAFDKNITEKNAVKTIETMLKEKDAEITTLKALSDENTALREKVKTIQSLEQKVRDLEPLATDGKAYRSDLEAQYVANKAKLKEVAETPEAQNKIREILKNYPIDFLKTEVEHLEKRVTDKYPDEGQLKGDHRRDKSSSANADEDLLIPD